MSNELATLDFGSGDEGLEQSNYNASEVAELAKSDPNFLAALASPDMFKYFWPPVFLAVWTWLVQNVQLQREFPKLALGLPRGFGKTTLVKLFIVYVILFTKKSFILIMSNTEGHAKNIISDVIDMLDEPNIKSVFGDWSIDIQKKTEVMVRFSFRGKDIIIAGIGAEGSVRGLNVKNRRPDVMIFEDVQSREDADSKLVSDKLYQWMLGTAMKAKSPAGTMTLFIANMYPTPHSILKKLKANEEWIKFIAGGILADGTSLWEDLQPIDQLLKEYESDLKSGHPEIFFAEVLNDENASVNNLVDLTKIPEWPFVQGEIPLGNFIMIDPSNDKANSDNVAMGYFEILGDNGGKPCLMELIEEKLSPGETIQKAISMATRNGCGTVVIESNAYQYTLKYWSEFICKQMGIEGIRFLDIYSGRLSKTTRILTMFKEYQKGEILVHPDCKSRVDSQIASFNPLKTDNVDNTLDLLTYAPRIQQEMGEYLMQQTIIAQQGIDYEISQYPDSALTVSPF